MDYINNELKWWQRVTMYCGCFQSSEHYFKPAVSDQSIMLILSIFIHALGTIGYN